MTTEQRFGPRFVAEQRILSYDLAVLDEQLDLLPEPAGKAFGTNLWRDQNFWPDVIEPAAGAALRRWGFSVEFERR
ncbi:hypothetical protein [Streptomyces goshikiensis]|uniref:hypothetical protein n=1 Tax=Streptomyces goshikiensis TaxID=1942 RepID=UPI0022F3928C|nr:hypothetical protein [Streptomyces goshikiensis]WBY25005.1 hypothetical protein PET44_35855 [Streptomyces goshikiensis]